MRAQRFVADLNTPAALVSGPGLIENIEAMSARVANAGLELWPHVKTHKSPPIVQLQRDHGAAGFTAATVRELEMLAAGAHDDLLLANPPVGDWRLERVAEVAKKARLRVTLDSEEALAALDRTCRRHDVEIGWLWEIDSGACRMGTAPGAESARLIAPLAERYEHVSFSGLMTFPGHAYAAQSTQEIAAIAAAERAAVSSTADELARLGIEAPARSIGSTPTMHALESAEGATEARPGNYVFYDATQVALELVSEQRCALQVMATVVSRPDSRRLILDCGSKALGSERLTSRARGYALVAGRSELTVEKLYEEHAIVVAPVVLDDKIGDRLMVIPNHSCVTANLYPRLFVVESDEVLDEWTVAARNW